MSIPFEFMLFAATLVGVALLHSRSLEVAACGTGAVLLYKLAFTGIHGLSGLRGSLHHVAAEWLRLCTCTRRTSGTLPRWWLPRTPAAWAAWSAIRRLR